MIGAAAGHVGHEHGLALSLLTPAEGVQIGVKGELGENQFACSPCEAMVPIDVAYEKQELGEAEGAASDHRDDAGLGFELEPTADGLAIVLDARLPAPARAIAALAALRISEQTEVDVQSAARSGGGLLGRAVALHRSSTLSPSASQPRRHG